MPEKIVSRASPEPCPQLEGGFGGCPNSLIGFFTEWIGDIPDHQQGARCEAPRSDD